MHRNASVSSVLSENRVFGEGGPRNFVRDAALIPRDYRAHGVFSKTLVLHLCNIAGKAANVTNTSRSVIDEGEVAVKKMWRHEEEMLYRGIADFFFIQKKA